MMDKNLSERILWVTAVVVVVLGLVTAVRTFQEMRRQESEIRKYADFMRELSALAKRSARCESPVRAFAKLPNPHPQPLTELLRESLAGEQFRARDWEALSPRTIDGWIVKTRQVTLPKIELSKLAGFLAKVESLRPPWRMVACTIRAVSREGGNAYVTLTLEALDKMP